MRWTIAFGVIGLLVGNSLRADEREPIKLTIRGRAIETPILKYRLLPTEAELKPGNAVPILLRIAWGETKSMADLNRDFAADWEKFPWGAPEWKVTGHVLRESVYSELKRAAFRREATWEYPLGETQSPYSILLPDAGNMRQFLEYGLGTTIRNRLARGELDKAREGILIGFANGRHLSQAPFFIDQAIAAATHVSMLDRTGELIEKPDSPNLYWALTTLPDTLLSLDRAASLQASLFTMTLPAVNDLDRPRDAKEWRKMANQLVDLLEQLGAFPMSNRPKRDESLIGKFLQGLDATGKSRLTKFTRHARAELPRLLKLSEQKVAAMSDDEACVRWYVHTLLSRDHNFAAVLALPPREAWPRFKQLQAENKATQQISGEKIDAFWQPESLYISLRSPKRKINALRIVEAVRHQLATHDGNLPAALDDIKDVPIPLDPLTDRPFEWTVAGQNATLKAPPLPADVVEPGSARALANVLEYRLEVK